MYRSTAANLISKRLRGAASLVGAGGAVTGSNISINSVGMSATTTTAASASSASSSTSSSPAMVNKMQIRTHFGHNHSHSHGEADNSHSHGSTSSSEKKPRSPITRNRRVDSHHSHGYLNGCCHGHSHGQGNDLDLHGTNNFGAEGNHAPVLYVKPGELEDHVRGENLKACRAVTMVGASTNLIYCFLKITLGSQGGSVALLADGIHALVDFGADLISFASVHVTHRKYARSKFPFGLGRFETLTSLFIAVMLLSGGTALLLSALETIYKQYTEAQNAKEKKLLEEAAAAAAEAVAAAKKKSGSDKNADGEKSEDEKLAEAAVAAAALLNAQLAEKERTCEVPGCDHNHRHSKLPGVFGALACDHDEDFVLMEKDEHGNTKLLWPMIAVSVSCLIVKQGMYRWARKVGEKAGSRIVVANAYHHRADSWTSAIALVGVAGQVAGVPFLDGVAGAVVSGLILRTGIFVLQNSILELFDYQNSDVRCLAEHIRHTITDNYSREIPNLVNLYSTRHGHQYALNATMLVRAGETEDLQKLCTAQRIIENLAKREHKVSLSNVSVSLHEIEYDRRVPPQHISLFKEIESLAEALEELKAYRPQHKKIREATQQQQQQGDATAANNNNGVVSGGKVVANCATSSASSCEDESVATAETTAAATPSPTTTTNTTATATAEKSDNELDADEAAHQMHHRRRRVVNCFLKLHDFYGEDVLPLSSVTVNWVKNEIDARVIYAEEDCVQKNSNKKKKKKLSHAQQHRLEMLQEDLESVCYALGFDLIKM